MKVRRVPVLIVGAGYSGLTTALLLGWRGAPSLVVERRNGVSRHPKAHGLNRRSMEVLRGVEGIERDLFAASRGAANDSTVVIAETVTTPPLRTIVSKGAIDESKLSPAKVCSAGQDRVEPILLRHARAQGAEVRFSTSLLSFEQRPREVEAVLRDEETGETFHVLCDYLVAGDGGGSAIRKSLGIEMEGPGVLTHAVSILFEADLPSILKRSGFLLAYLQNPAFTAAFVTCDDPRFAQLNIEYDPNVESPRDFDKTRCEQLVRAALGSPDLEVMIHDVLPWEMSALVATHFSRGRVFLVGDAAHLMAPVGGLGGQSAIQDAANLAWKLAFVIKGHACAELLESYEAERSPVIHLSIARSIANYVERMRPDRQELRLRAAEADFLNVVLGHRYRSRAILSEQNDDGAATEDPRTPSVAPGFRVPHVTVIHDGETLSIHDLIGRGFLLIAGRDGDQWVSAAQRFAQRTAFPLSAYRIGFDLRSEGDLHAALRLPPDGALIIRPDGFVAWRAEASCPDAEARLYNVIAHICGRPHDATEQHAARLYV